MQILQLLPFPTMTATACCDGHGAQGVVEVSILTILFEGPFCSTHDAACQRGVKEFCHSGPAREHWGLFSAFFLPGLMMSHCSYGRGALSRCKDTREIGCGLWRMTFNCVVEVNTVVVSFVALQVASDIACWQCLSRCVCGRPV